MSTRPSSLFWTIVGALAVAGVVGLSSSSYSAATHQPAVVSAGQIGQMQAGDTLAINGGLTVSANTTLTGTAFLQKNNMSPVNALGQLTFQSSYNNWTSIGQGSFSVMQPIASDNTGSVITGADASSASVGDWLVICNHNAPTDDGVIALSNEDGNSLASNQFKLPDSGRVSDDVSDHYTVSNGTCALLMYMQPDQSDATNFKWVVLAGATRQTRQIVQLQQWFPACDTTHLTGVVNDFNGLCQARAVPDPQNAAMNTTITSGSNGQTLPQPTLNVTTTTGFTQSGRGATTLDSSMNTLTLPRASITVASTSSFWNNASLFVIFVTTSNGVQEVTCTGQSGGNTFTTCSGGTGSMSTGGAVTGKYYSLAVQATLNGFKEWYYVKCAGTATGTTFTGCVEGQGSLATNNKVVGNPMCEAGSSCFQDDHSVIRVQTVDSTGVTITGFHWTTNAYPQGLGPVKRIINYGPGPVYIPNLTGSASGNQVTTPNAGTIPIPANSSLTLWHYSTDGAWSIQNHTGHGELINRQVFVGSTTYTPFPGTMSVTIRMCGQGGGGGGAQGFGGGSAGGAAGGGGGAGDYWEKHILCSTFASDAPVCTGSTVTIANSSGGGGASTGGNGATGSSVSIIVNGGTLTAAGGVGGTGMTTSTAPNIAAGGTQSSTGTAGADVDSRGAEGGYGIHLSNACQGGVRCGIGGNGASSPFGSGGIGNVESSAGSNNGFGYCSGGSGGSTEYGTGVGDGSGGFAGGSGAGGIIIVDEFD